MANDKEVVQYESFVDGQVFKNYYGYLANPSENNEFIITFPTELKEVIGFQLTLENSEDLHRYAKDGDNRGAKESFAVVITLDGETFKFKTSQDFIRALRKN